MILSTDSQQRNEVYLRRLEALEASIERQSISIKTFDPLVPMIGYDVTKKIPNMFNPDSDFVGNQDETGSVDADNSNNSGGSDVTEVMADLDDSTGDVSTNGR